MTWRPSALAAAPATASRRAGAASPGGVVRTAAAPALAAPLAAKTNGRVARASCQTGTAVLAMSAAVYVVSGIPHAPAATRAARPAGAGTYGVQASAAATAVASPLAVSSHEPTLIGDVTLKTRSMFKNRDDLPRSEMSSGGLAPKPASALSHARRASASFPRSP